MPRLELADRPGEFPVIMPSPTAPSVPANSPRPDAQASKDAAAKEAASLVTNPNTCLIDASTAHRTDPGWVFGLPELAPGQRDLIRGSKRIANPGCHASAFILLLRPLVDTGLVPADAALSATSITGM